LLWKEDARMAIFRSWAGEEEAAEDMACAKRPLDLAKVDELVRQLKLSVKDPLAFKSVYTELLENKSLGAQEAIEIAHRFVGGFRHKSKKAALAAIGQERLRLAHAKAKGESAAKTRTW
jgi:hypothetical protein